MKKIIILIVLVTSFFITLNSYWNDLWWEDTIKSNIIPIDPNYAATGALTAATAWLSPISKSFQIVKDIIFWLLALFAIWSFLYFWFKLVVAQWNQEEFKKAMSWFVYTIIGIILASLAWWIIKLISSIQF